MLISNNYWLCLHCKLWRSIISVTDVCSVEWMFSMFYVYNWVYVNTVNVRTSACWDQHRNRRFVCTAWFFLLTHGSNCYVILIIGRFHICCFSLPHAHYYYSTIRKCCEMAISDKNVASETSYCCVACNMSSKHMTHTQLILLIVRITRIMALSMQEITISRFQN